MIKKVRNNIGICLSISMYGIFISFKLFLKNMNNTMQNLLVICLSITVLLYLIWYFVYLKDTNKEEYRDSKELKIYRLFYNFTLVSAINFIIPLLNSICSRFFSVYLTDSITDSLYQIILLCSVVFFYLSTINIGIKIAGMKWYYLIIGTVLIIFIGFFDTQWWTALPLLTAIVFYYSSEDVYFNLSNGDDSGENIQKNIKLKWNNDKELIISGSFYLYLSLIIGSLIKETPLYLKLMYGMFKNSNENSHLESIFTMGIIRIFIFGMLFMIGTLGLYFLREKTRYFHYYKKGLAMNRSKRESVLKYKRYRKRKH